MEAISAAESAITPPNLNEMAELPSGIRGDAESR